MPLHEEAQDQHQQQGYETVSPYSLHPLLLPAEVEYEDPLLQSEVARHQQGQQQEPDFTQAPGHRHREGILPGAVQQAVHHEHHGGQRQGGEHGAHQQPAGEAELVLGYLADARGNVLAVLNEVAGQFQPAPGQPQQPEASQGQAQGLFSAMALGSCSQLAGLKARPRAAGTPSSTAGLRGARPASRTDGWR